MSVSQTPGPRPKDAIAEGSPTLAGQWTYRSYRNTADLVNGNADKALAFDFRGGRVHLRDSFAAELDGNARHGRGLRTRPYG
jgi:hypothetical protein